MANERASKKQQELLSFVDGFMKEHGYAPSYREIMNALGYKSVSTVAIHINGLIAKGYMSRGDANSQRTLEIVSLRPNIPSGATATSDWKKEFHAYIASKELNDDERQIVERALAILALEEPPRGKEVA